VQRAFTRIAFTEAVKAEQRAGGTREFCADLELRQPNNDVLAPRAIAFIESVDTAFVSTCSRTGWPYVQHRGGPRGFIRVLGPSTIAFEDFDGNQQFITLGNLRENPRIMLILMNFDRHLGARNCCRAAASGFARNSHAFRGPAHHDRCRSLGLQLLQAHNPAAD